MVVKYLLFVVSALIVLFMSIGPFVFNMLYAEDAQIGEWSGWSECGKTCGESWKGRYRNCTKKAKGYGLSCSELAHFYETKACKKADCPIDGGVGEWHAWEACLQQCAQSTRKRVRLCDNPKPTFYGANCVEQLEEVVPCPAQNPCPIHFKFSEWSPWSPCSVTCGEGEQSRTSKCIPPQHGGNACPQPEKIEKTICKAGILCSVPVDFKFLEWGAWSACSVTCGEGEQTRISKCEGPQHGGKPCPEPEKKESQKCVLAACPAGK